MVGVHLLDWRVRAAEVVGFLQVLEAFRSEPQPVGQGLPGLDGPLHGAGYHVVDALGGQEVGRGLGLSEAERRERRVGWTVVSLVGFRQGVPDDDQLHKVGT